MVKLIAIYKQPEIKENFDEHYYNVHTPLVKKVPGLEKVEVSKIFGSPTGKSEYHLLAQLYFKDKDTFNTAMNSPEMKAAGKDLMGFAGPLVTMMFGEEVEV
jgi:uncharacterized protein (TIGR02118 family)